MPWPYTYPLIQIAGVHDLDEAFLIARAGATHIGFPLRLPVHREDLTEEAAAEIVRRLPSDCVPVLITYLGDAGDIIAFTRMLGVSTVQLHGGLPASEAAQLRARAPDLTVIKSLIVRPGSTDQLFHELRMLEPYVDAFITDTFDPVTGACGATGLTHDWAVSRALVEATPRPLILAGGLTPDNVGEAIRRVRPFGVDAHTGVEGKDGRKDDERVRRFVMEARAAFDALRS